MQKIRDVGALEYKCDGYVQNRGNLKGGWDHFSKKGVIPCKLVQICMKICHFKGVLLILDCLCIFLTYYNTSW